MAITREKLEALVWRHTPRDMKGIIDGKKSVMAPASAGGGIWFLSSMSWDQLVNYVPRPVAKQHNL